MKPTPPAQGPIVAAWIGPRGARRWFARLLMVAATTLAATAAPKIRIGVEHNSPPLSFVDARQQPTGFTPELLHELGRSGGLEFEIVTSSWSRILQEFQAGRLDALANVTITAERRATMEFSISHASLHAITYTRPGAPTFTSTAQFPGKTMATLGGTVGHLNAIDHNGWGARVVRFDSWRAMLEAVRDGQCDFALLMRRLKPEQPDELGLNRAFVDDIIYPFHLAVHSGDARTLERLNAALATVRSNGTFETIYTRWIGPIEPRPIRLRDLRPYAASTILALGCVAALFYWQQRVKRRLVRQATALRESEEKHRLLVENAHEGIFVLQEGKFCFVNPAVQQFTGLTPSELLGRHMLDLIQPEDRVDVIRRHEQLLSGEVLQQRRDYRVALPSGRELWISLTAVLITWQGRSATLNFATDITESRRTELARREAAERLEKIANRVPGFVYQYRLRPDGTSCFPYASDGIERIYQVRADEVREDATKAFAIGYSADLPGLMVSIQESARDLTPWRYEFRVHLRDGTVGWLAGNSVPQREPDGSVLWHGLISDVTDRKQAEELVRESLREKEALLKEVHHRVKNNLQVITSLLRLEAGRSAENATRVVLKSMQSRIRAMALLHESLYRSGSFARVDLAGYLRQVATQLFRAQNSDAGSVRLGLDLKPAEVEIDQAIPCGLIVNELLTNALKHAFPGGRAGEVRVTLHAVAGGPVRLCVSDDGVGLPADFEAKRGTSLGLQLVADLTRQIHGTVTLGPAATFTIVFVPRLPATTPDHSPPPTHP
jgi:PAS domain S-box-containing protein